MAAAPAAAAPAGGGPTPPPVWVEVAEAAMLLSAVVCFLLASFGAMVLGVPAADAVFIGALGGFFLTCAHYLSKVQRTSDLRLVLAALLQELPQGKGPS